MENKYSIVEARDDYLIKFKLIQLNNVVISQLLDMVNVSPCLSPPTHVCLIFIEFVARYCSFSYNGVNRML